MSDAAALLERARASQRRASAPGHSAWVEANAGTGKTRVLTDRVMRLLLEGAEPARILCVTFTKAAAAEMRNRLAGDLGRWAMMDPATLDEEIEMLIERPPLEQERTTARRLFARVLDAPGGINILTIHAFCQSLLKRFPLEAGVPPGFEVLDEGEAASLLRHAQDAQIERLARPGAPEALAKALADVANKASMAEYAELMNRLLAERVWLLAHIADEMGLRRMRQRLIGVLDCERQTEVNEPALRRAARALIEAGGKQDPPRGEAIAGWLAAGDSRSDLSEPYLAVFFKSDGLIRENLATKAARDRMSEIVDVLQAEARRLERAKGLALVELTMALLRLGLDIVKRYADAKRRRAVLDYDDLIVATRGLLEGAESAAWVLYKLDGGIDHVLIDEAQDTNPDQWEVVRRLTEEFFAGAGAVDRERTVFAVGDTKQSIFGFQRADPRKLAEMRAWFEQRSREANKRFAEVGLTVSFRSTRAVLTAVDRVFARQDAARGLAEPGDVMHEAIRLDEPGKVVLWPLVCADGQEIDHTDLEAAGSTGSLPYERLARLIAAHAKSLIGRERRPRGGEKLNAGHFMVLVRRRNQFVNALVRALKREHIEVAGVDRLDLGEELAIQDLLSIARFVLLPQDDLNLACLLKSPLVGLDEDRLFALAWKRTGHLWRALRARARDPAYAPAHARLSAWLRRADFVTPFDFFAQALGAEGGRRRLLERLGREAADPIDELLARALQYQRAEAGSLQGFLRWFEQGGGEIKRDLDANRRPEVRILTVHAAKGLQAPIVYLPDTTRLPGDSDRLLADAEGGTRLWLPRVSEANPAARAWRHAVRERDRAEQNRLLYVAMTRAQDQLYVGGWFDRKKPDDGCWYDKIKAGLQESSAIAKTFDFSELIGEDGWRGEGFELANEGRVEVPDQDELELPDALPLPAWTGVPAPVEPDPPQPLAPSQPLPDEAAGDPRSFGPLDGDDPRRWQRGLLIHELLRRLPEIPAAKRARTAERFLSRPALGLSKVEIAGWTREALAVTEAPDHALLFAAGSRAEVPLIGTVKTPHGRFTVSGQVDRLAVSDREVLIVDYKTNRPPPRAPSEVALAYRRQLALYRALLGEIYPGRRVRAFLIWTAVPRIMEIDGETLDRSMPYLSPS